MKRIPAAVALVLLAVLAIAGVALAQTPPEFRLGFKVLADQIPDVVGKPIEAEHYGPDGDSLQQTSTGLMVWRKADNWTAFTNGSRTWINGPAGVQNRGNNESFDWEKATESVPSATPPPTVVQPNPTPVRPLCVLAPNALQLRYRQNPDWTWAVEGTLLNSCDRMIESEVNLLAYVGEGGSGYPLMDAPSVFVTHLAPGDRAPIKITVPRVQFAGSWKTWMIGGDTDDEEYATAEVGASRQIEFSPHLGGAVLLLAQAPDGDKLLKAAAEGGIRLRSDTTPEGSWGTYDLKTKTVTISSELERYSAWARGAVLAHELRHAVDDLAGKAPRTSGQCYQFEAAAFRQEAVVWTQLWQGHLPGDVDAIHAELNDITISISKDPVGFALDLLTRYEDECG